MNNRRIILSLVIVAVFFSYVFGVSTASGQTSGGPAAAPAVTASGSGSPSFGSDFSQLVHLDVGTVILRPFLITPITPAPGSSSPSYQLKLGAADVRGMVQGTFQLRGAWLPDDLRTSWANSYLCDHIDQEARIGYAYAGNSGSQSSTTTGSGDFYGELAFGWHGTPWDLHPFYASLGPEGYFDFSSDADYSEMHTAVGAGLAYAGGYAVDSTKTNVIQFLIRPGFIFADSPNIIGYNTNGPVLGVNSSGLPSFSWRGAFDLSAEVRIPVAINQNQYGSFSVGGAFYEFSGSAPGQWSVYVAYSVDPLSLMESVFHISTGTGH
ncbi:MAG: hypothetical protein ABSA83_20940 [Verrucomicrobiota bacterium]|jgi:hypothetical protein